MVNSVQLMTQIQKFYIYFLNNSFKNFHKLIEWKNFLSAYISTCPYVMEYYYEPEKWYNKKIIPIFISYLPLSLLHLFFLNDIATSGCRDDYVY